MQALFNEENKTLNYYRAMYEKFMTISLDGEESESIIQSLQDIINRPVTLYDDSENAVIPSQHSVPFQLDTDTVRAESLNDYLMAYDSPQGVYHDNPAGRTKEDVPICLYTKAKPYEQRKKSLSMLQLHLSN
ncbi:hypothetical protein RWE15_09200 [Virgibacillus halophilus]|uniref:Uncharacterized protein n=1 Tax=Tigheibacillus halophilus TaxID=361280 RepID=A0ABU5C6X2_9BACI|nr:hypothetical protein [Virgibacillus halophilus]